MCSWHGGDGGWVVVGAQRMAKRVRAEVLHEALQNASAAGLRRSDGGGSADPSCEVCKLSKSRIVTPEEEEGEAIEAGR